MVVCHSLNTPAVSGVLSSDYSSIKQRYLELRGFQEDVALADENARLLRDNMLIMRKDMNGR